MSPQDLLNGVESNTQAIAGLIKVLNVLVAEFIPTNAQQSAASSEQIGQIAGLIEKSLEAIASLTDSLSRSQQHIAALTEVSAFSERRVKSLADGTANSRQQLASLTRTTAASGRQITALTKLLETNQEAIAFLTQLSKANHQAVALNAEGLARIEADSAERGRQIDTLIAENKAERQERQTDRESCDRKFSEMLAVITDSGRRIEQLESRVI